MNALRHGPQPKRTPPSVMVRLMLVLFAVVQVVAPSWHLCSLGGHCADAGHSAGAHGKAGQTQVAHGSGHVFQKPEPQQGQPPQPIICICLPEKEEQASAQAGATNEGAPDAPQMMAASTQSDEPFCLAKLLQSMPGEAAIPFDFQTTLVPVGQSELPAPFQVIPSAQLRPFQARGPPIRFL